MGVLADGLHLDTLRNFVDLPNLPDQGPEEHLRPRIRVIDMDGSVFRRLTGGDAQDRLWLWLYNVLVVSCFLKVAFEDHPEFRRVWWDKIRAAVHHVASRRDAPPGPGHTFVTQARWDTEACAKALRRGFDFADEPPERQLARGGRAHGARGYMAHYLLYEPLQELHERYVDVVLNEARAPNPAQRRGGQSGQVVRPDGAAHGAAAGALLGERVAPRARAPARRRDGRVRRHAAGAAGRKVHAPHAAEPGAHGVGSAFRAARRAHAAARAGMQRSPTPA